MAEGALRLNRAFQAFILQIEQDSLARTEASSGMLFGGCRVPLKIGLLFKRDPLSGSSGFRVFKA